MLRKWGSSVRGGFFASAFFLCACSGGQKGATAPTGEESAEGVGRANESAAPQILKPAPAPSGVVARFRVKNTGALVDSVFKAAATPLDWRKLLEGDPEEFPWARAIDWEGAVEGVLAMNVKNPQNPHAAFSVGVRGIGPVLGLLESQKIVPLEGPGEVYYFEVTGEHCALGPALGRSAARVVCSPLRASLDLLLPYALRGLPTEVLSEGDVYMEFEMEPLRAAYGNELKTLLRWAPAAARAQHQGNRTFDSALSDGAAELAREGTALIDEIERLTVQVTQESGSFTGAVNLELKNGDSDVAKIFSDLKARQSSLPAIFDELPSSASSAGYSREIAKKHAQKWMSILADLVRGAAELNGASAGFSKRLGSAIKRLGPAGETGVFARGPLVSQTVNGKAELRSAWVLSGTTRSKDEVVKLLDDISWLMASNDMKKLSSSVQSLPQLKRKNVAISGAPGATVFEWKLPPEWIAIANFTGAQMSSGVDIEHVLGAVQSLQTGLVAVHQIGENTWISWGQTPEELVASFAAMSGQNVPRLGSLGGLEGVRSEPAVSAGFARLDALVGMASFLFPSDLLDDWSGLGAALPNQGNTPVRYSFRVDKAKRTTVTWNVWVPAKFIEDLAAFGATVQERQSAKLKELSQ